MPGAWAACKEAALPPSAHRADVTESVAAVCDRRSRQRVVLPRRQRPLARATTHPLPMALPPSAHHFDGNGCGAVILCLRVTRASCSPLRRNVRCQTPRRWGWGIPLKKRPAPDPPVLRPSHALPTPKFDPSARSFTDSAPSLASCSLPAGPATGSHFQRVSLFPQHQSVLWLLPPLRACCPICLLNTPQTFLGFEAGQIAAAAARLQARIAAQAQRHPCGPVRHLLDALQDLRSATHHTDDPNAEPQECKGRIS